MRSYLYLTRLAWYCVYWNLMSFGEGLSHFINTRSARAVELYIRRAPLLIEEYSAATVSSRIIFIHSPLELISIRLLRPMGR